MNKQWLLASLLGLAPLPALASAFYVAVDAAHTGFDVDATDDYDGINESSNGYGLGIGFRFNRVLSLEITERDLGDLS